MGSALSEGSLRNPLVQGHLRAAGLHSQSYGLDDLPWEHESPVFTALGRRFQVRASDENLGSFIDDVFAGMRTTAAPSGSEVVRYSLIAPTELHGSIFRGYTQLHWNRDPAALLERFVRDINQHAIRSQAGWLKFHAGVVDRQGVGVVLAAPMESGKSTLTAGLLLRGYRYLSDEIAAICLDDGKVHAYPKPLGLDPGSWPLFPDFAPDEPEYEVYQRHQWQVSPRRFPAGSVSTTVPRVIMLPSYSDKGGTRLESLSPAEAVIGLSACAFAGAQATADSLRRITRLTASASCYRLQHDDLADACQAIDEVVEEALRFDATDSR